MVERLLHSSFKVHTRPHPRMEIEMDDANRVDGMKLDEEETTWSFLCIEYRATALAIVAITIKEER